MAHAHCMLDNEGYKHTLRIYDTAYPLQQRLREGASVLLYRYVACLVVYSTEFTAYIAIVHFQHSHLILGPG